MHVLNTQITALPCSISSKDCIDAPRNVEALKSVVDRCLGENYLSAAYIEHFLGEPGSICRVAYADSQAVGMVMARKLHETHSLFDLLNPGYRWGEIRTLCVLPNYRARGIGSDLLQDAVNLLANTGCEKIVTTAWKSTNPQNSLSLFEKLNFEILAEIRHYWRLSHGPSNPCPDCGPVCFCSALVMTKNVA